MNDQLTHPTFSWGFTWLRLEWDSDGMPFFKQYEHAPYQLPWRPGVTKALTPPDATEGDEA